jgi:hypothetical protein
VVTYEDPEQVETMTAKFGFTDLKLIAQSMTQSFLGSDSWGGDRPRIVLGEFRNRTSEHIDISNVTDTIRTSLVQSQQFSILAGDVGIFEIQKELDYQQAGTVDQALAVELGKQMGAEFVFYGALTDINKEKGSTEAVWFKFNMSAVNVQTREIIWQAEETIAKKKEKSFFGW